jgi:hypothetical protein
MKVKGSTVVSSGEEKYQELVKNFNSIPHQKGLFLSGLTEIPKTPLEFLINFFPIYNKKHVTIDKNQNNKVVTDLGSYYPYFNRNRSVQEVYFILTSYYPDYDLKTYFIDLYEVAAHFYRRCCLLQYKDREPYALSGPSLMYMFCHDIKRHVVHYAETINMLSYFPDPTKTFPIPVFSRGALALNVESPSIPLIWRLMADEELQKYLLGDKYINEPKLEIKKIH